MSIDKEPDLPIDNAVNVLRSNIKQIHTVCEWADVLGYSRPYFHDLIREKFGTTPYEIIKQEKFKKVKKLVQANPHCKGFVIARKAGFQNMQSLYHFLKWNFDTTLTRLRSQLTPASQL